MQPIRKPSGTVKPAAPRRKPDARKRIAIMRAALYLFLKHGYAQTSMDAVAARAGVTKQTVYAHCKSKDALFELIVSELAARHAPAFDAEGGAGQDLDARLFDIGARFLDMATSADGLAATRLVISEASRRPKLAAHYYESASRGALRKVADCFATENRRGRMHIAHPSSAAAYFLTLLKGNYYLRILLNIKPAPTKREKNSHIRECVEIFLRLYGGPDALQTRNSL